MSTGVDANISSFQNGAGAMCLRLKSANEAWFYIDRIAGGDRNHCDSRFVAAACPGQGQTAGHRHEMREQPQASRDRQCYVHGRPRGSLPLSSHEGASWVDTLQPYLSGTNLHRCPTDRNTMRLYSYAINDFLLPPDPPAGRDYSKFTAVPSPSDTLFLAECSDSNSGSDHLHLQPEIGDPPLNANTFAGEVAVKRHLEGATYLFVDSHAERLLWSVTKREVARTGSRFVYPAGAP
jgi:prepilin-type processing-associated H-X9-DG protein